MGDRPATRLMEETVIYSVDDYYTVQPVTPSSGHSSAIPTVHGLLLPYVAGDCQLVTATERRQLRSSDIPTLVVHRTSMCFGDRCFRSAASGSGTDFHRRWEVTHRQFCRQFNSHLFVWVETATHVDAALSSAVSYSYLLTYLLTYVLMVFVLLVLHSFTARKLAIANTLV